MPSRFFPPASLASPDGLVHVGGPLTVERLLDAYRNGIFPWPHREGDPMLWFSPDPRAVLPLDRLHVSRRLVRRLRCGAFTFTCDQAFAEVLSGCASGAHRHGGTWLLPEMIDAYVELHRQGHAHSIETWMNGELVGGVYGVAIGGLFAAESMFYRRRDASKAALARLVRAPQRPRLPTPRHPTMDPAHRPPGRRRDLSSRLPATAGRGRRPAG